jgi:hypothetical protein
MQPVLGKRSVELDLPMVCDGVQLVFLYRESIALS